MSCNGCRQTNGPKPIRQQKTKGFFGEDSSNEMTHEEVRSKSPIESPRTPCQCENKDGNEHIYCERHKCLKTPSLHSLCQYRRDYYDLWEQGIGPMQSMLPEKKEEKDTHVEPSSQGFFMGDPDIPSKSRGLGDTVAKITKVTGIKKVVDTVNNAMGRECGCKERQSKLNKLVPYEKPKKTRGFFQ